MSKKLIWFQPTTRQLAALQKEQRRRGKSMDAVVKTAVAKLLQDSHLPREFSQEEFVAFKKANPKFNFDSGEKTKDYLLYKGRWWKTMFWMSAAFLVIECLDNDHDGVPDIFQLFNYLLK